MKKLISLFLSLIMIVSVVAVGMVTTNAETFTDENGIEWIVAECYPGWAIKFSNNNTSLPKDVVIPSTYNNKVIVAIDLYASGQLNLHGDSDSITIPRSIQSIGWGAFNWDGYKTINFESPSSLRTIDGHAFSTCTSLTSITIPEGVTSLGQGTFHSCYNLESVTLPSTLEEIGDECFKYCSKLKEINIPNSVKTIGKEAFYGCGFTEIVLPTSLKKLGESCFYECRNLQSVTIPNNTIDSIPTTAFSSCENLTEVNIPNNINKIGQYAFSGCTSLANITLPNQLQEIEYGAFSNTSISRIQIPDSVKYLAGFQYTKLTSIEIPNSVVEIGGEAFSGCSDLIEATLPNSLETIGQYSFYNCKNLNLSSIPQSVKTIKEHAFYNCNNLTSSVVSNENTILESYAFNDIDYVSTPDNTIRVEQGYWVAEGDGESMNVWVDTYRVRNSSSLTIPSEIQGYTITGIKYKAFSNLQRLTNIYFPSTIKEIGDGAFSGCRNLGYNSRINLPESLISIGDNAFAGCTLYLKNINLPDGLKSIGEKAFYDCDALENIEIPNSVEYIGEQAFAHSSLKTITLPQNLKEINKCVFMNSDLESVEIPDSVEIIKNGAFEYTNITEITIPDSVKYIDDYAFHNCENLQSVNMSEQVEYIGKSAFAYTKLTDIYLPSNVKVNTKAFSDIPSVDALTINCEKLSQIDTFAFYNTPIGEFILGEDVETIDTALLSSNVNLSSLSINRAMKVPTPFAFYGDENLTVLSPVEAVNTELVRSTKYANVPLRATNGIIESGGSKDAIVTLTTDPAIFKVTVPTVLPFTVDSDSNVTVANNAQVINNSNGQVKVTGVTAQTTEGWSIVANGTDFREVPVDSKQFTFTLNGDNFAAGNNVPLTLGSAWTVIDGKASMDLPYNGTFAVQSQPKVKLPIANTIFTIAWNKAD